MKNIFKKIGFLCTALLALSLGTSVNKVEAAGENTATLTFDDKNKIVLSTNTQQVWEEDGITLTYNKGSYNNNLAEYANPVRFYANTEIIIEKENMTQIVFDCNSTSYATTLNGSISGSTVSSDKVTVSLAEPTNSFTIAKLDAQVRMDSLTITFTANEEPETPVEKTPTEEVNELFTTYYNNGSYKRSTIINMNEEAKTELISCFHAKSNLLERDTYFIGDELWMTNDKGGYSYYGTEGENMTSAHTEKALYQPTKVATALVGETMEDHYTTLFDIKDNEAEWTKNGNVYSTTDATVIKYFLDFTAPCFLGLDNTNKNYWSMSSVEVEETTDGKLELRLVTTGDTGKLTDPNGYLSVATIAKENSQVTTTNIADALTAESGTLLDLIGTVVSYYSSGTNSFILQDSTGARIIVYSPNKEVNLNDKVEVTGAKVLDNNKIPQVGSKPKVTILEESGFEPKVIEVSLEEAVNIASDLDTDIITQDKYTITGNINISNNNYFVTDGTNSIQLYNGSLDGLHQDCGVTITGSLTRYNTTAEMVRYEIDEIINCLYDITITSSENGSVTTANTKNIEYGTEVTFTVTPEEGYKVEYVKINDVTQQVEDGKVTIEVKEDLVVTASFIEENVTPELKETIGTLSFANIAQRTEFSTSKQVWKQNGITVTNNKASSNNDIANYSNPIRFYAGSNLIVEATGDITQIEFTVSGSSYATPLKNSIGTVSGATVSVSGTKVTVKFTNAVESYTITQFTAQVRMSSLTVTYLA